MFPLSKFRSMWVLPIATAFILASAPVQAEAQSSADRFMKEFGGKAIAVFADRKMSAPERNRAMRRLLVENFDLNRISKFVLSRHWRKASDEEKVEFRKAFEDYIVYTYGRRLGNYSGENLVVQQTQKISEDRAVVKSRILRPNGKPINANWMLQYDNARWSIVDVVVEGVSMSVTQRSEFSSVIRSAGGKVAGLNAKLRSITGSMMKDNDKAMAAKEY